MTSLRSKAPRKKYHVIFIADVIPVLAPAVLQFPITFSQFISRIPEKVEWRDIAALFELAYSQERFNNAPGWDESGNAKSTRNMSLLCYPMNSSIE
jgi:hypothetical protein